MALDASIYNNIQQPKPVNLLADYANLMQVQGAQQANKLNQLKFDAYEREQQDNNALRSALSAPGADPYNALLRIGRVKEAAEYRKAEVEGRRAKIGEDSDAFELANKRYKLFQGTLGALSQEQNLTKDLVLQAGQGLVQQGLLPKALFDQTAATLPDDPAQLRARLVQGLKTQMTPAEIFKTFSPTPEKIDNGGQISFRDTNPNSPTYGQATAGAAVQKVQSPDNRASVSASMANAAATREVAAATRDAAKIKANQDTEMKLGDDYRTQSKNFKETVDAYKQITAVLDKATTSPVATLAGATKFMKMIDPGSVVRESELGMALAATGVFDRVTNYVNTLRNGKVLTAQQVADFKDITKQIYGAAQAVQKQIDTHYTNQAKQYGLRPEMIVQELGQSDRAEPPKPAGSNVDALLEKYK